MTGDTKTGHDGILIAETLQEACRLAAVREYNEALGLFRRIGRQSRAFAAMCGEALCLYRMGRLKEALEVSSQAAAEAPARGEPHFLSGLSAKDAGDYDLAVASFNRALELGFSRSATIYHRGAALFLADRLEEAQADFEEAARLEGTKASVLYNLGVVLIHRGRWAEAVEAFSACAGLDGRNAATYHRIICAIGRAQASEEFHFRGHRIKNMLSILADSCSKQFDAPTAAATEPALAAEVTDRLRKVLAEMGELLSFVRQEPLDLDVWDIHDVLETALVRAGEALAHMVVCRRFAADVPGVVCDADILGEAFLNIILNAAEAMPDGGILTVSTASQCRNAVRVEFEDTGGGIAVEPVEKIFQFAFTTKEGGTGLGLCQVSRAVAQHGGTVSAKNGAAGALVTVQLPLVAAAGERIQEIGLRPYLSDEINLLCGSDAAISLEVSVAT